MHPDTRAPAPTTPDSDAPWQLLGDIGGTHARLACRQGASGAMQAMQVLPVQEFASLEAALAHYLKGLPPFMRPTQAALAMANPVTGDWVHMTNHHWQFSIRALQAQLGMERLRVINDFTALALALHTLQPGEYWQVGGPISSPPFARTQATHHPHLCPPNSRPPSNVAPAPLPVALLGPGTGLGVSGLIPNAQGGWLPLSGEGGHVTLAAPTEAEQQVLACLARRHGHVSAERVLSGPGLSELHAALLELTTGQAPTPLWTPAAVTAAALAPQPDQLSQQALALFAGFLGQVAGNLALTLGARGGVFLGGGILPKLGRSWLLASPFRAQFEAKGRFQPYLADIPVWVIDTPNPPALRGAGQALS